MEFLLKLMRMGHTILGITAPPPEHERAYLLGWILSLIFMIAFSIGLRALSCPQSHALERPIFLPIQRPLAFRAIT